MLSLVMMIALHAAMQHPPPVVLSMRTGSAQEGLGVSRDDESSPEGPGSLAVDAEGRFWVLDAVHRRVAVLAKDGSLEASVPLPSDTIEDLALLPSGELAVLDRLVARRVYVLAENGTLLASAPVEGPGVEDGGLVTALFADESGVWLEVQRAAHVRVLDAKLREDLARSGRPGLPFGDGFVRLRKVGDSAQVLLLDAAGAPRADGAVHFSSLLELSGLVARGDGLWVAGHELVQSAPGARPSRDVIVVVRLSQKANGAFVERGRREAKASPEFVPLKQLVAAGDQGVAHLYVDSTARRGARAIEVTSW